MSQHERYIEAFKTYFTLKHDYEKKLSKTKKKIYNNQMLSEREKREELAKLQPKCINCKNPGGTLFTQEGKNLRAVCGNTQSPCQLNIDITRGGYINAFEIQSAIQDTTNEKKVEIIKSKLNLLFGYMNEDETSEQFEQLLNDYKDNEQLLEIVNTSINNVTDNIDKKEKIHELKILMYELVSNIRKDSKEYEKNKEKTLLNNIVEETINNILPSATKLRELSYNVNNITYDSDDETFHLNQIPYIETDIQLDLEEPPIVTSFVVGLKKKVKKPKKLLEIAPDISGLQED